MKTYEAIFIFRPEEEVMNTGKNYVLTEMKNVGITVKQETDMGLKQLAYTIKKTNQGHYFNFEIDAPPETLKPLDKLFNIKSEILKFVFFKKD